MRSLHPRASGPLPSLSVAAILLTLVSSTASAQAIPSEFGAAGAPYADPAYCRALPALVKNFENTILPKQAQDLADQRSRLSEAEAGRAEAAQEFNQAVRDSIKTLATDQLSTAKALRARVNAMRASGMSQAARREWLERIKTIEEAGETIKQGMGRADFVESLQKNQTDLASFMKFVEDSGAADVALKGLADTLAPGVGGLVVSGIKVGLDVVYAGLKGRFTAQDAAQWRENVARLDAAHRELKDKVDGYRQDLTGGVCGPRVAQQVQNSPRPIPPQADAAAVTTVPVTTVPVTTVPPSTGGSNVGKIVGWTALLGGSVLGGLYVASELEAISELENFTGSSNTTTTNNNPAPVRETPSSVGLGTFRCGPEGEFHVGIRCEGAVNIRAGTRMAARQGAQLTVVTQPTTFIGRFVAPGLDGTTGTVQLRVDTFPSLCRAQTLVSFTADGNLFFETIQMSIPVSCR